MSIKQKMSMAKDLPTKTIAISLYKQWTGLRFQKHSSTPQKPPQTPHKPLLKHLPLDYCVCASPLHPE